MNTREKLLIVDDEADVCDILRFNLECEGFSVDAVHSAEEALRLLPGGSYRLILLDVMMGGMSGFTMADKVRKDLRMDLPILFLTARTTENDLLTGFRLGGDDYISKPFSIKEVTARVKAVLKRSVSSEAVLHKGIELGGLRIDADSKTVSLEGRTVTLTRKEFDILCTLAGHPNKIFSREDLLGRVWPGDSYVLDRTVDVHIARLRKKLGSFGERITNRSGFGYCVDWP